MCVCVVLRRLARCAALAFDYGTQEAMTMSASDRAGFERESKNETMASEREASHYCTAVASYSLLEVAGASYNKQQQHASAAVE